MIRVENKNLKYDLLTNYVIDLFGSTETLILSINKDMYIGALFKSRKLIYVTQDFDVILLKTKNKINLRRKKLIHI